MTEDMTGPAAAAGHDSWCGAARRGEEAGTPCRRPAGWGTEHPGRGRCKLHGGSTPNHERSAEVAQAIDDANAVLVAEGLPPVTDPTGRIAQLAAEADGFRSALARQVNALTSVRYTNGRGEQLRAEVALYERALDRTGRLCEALAKLGYAERLVQLEEAQVELVTVAMQSMINMAIDGGVPDEHRPVLLRSAATALREIDGLWGGGPVT